MAEKQFVIRIENNTQSGAGQKVGGAGGIANRTNNGAQNAKKKLSPSDKIEQRLAKMLTPAAIIRGAKSIVDQVGNHHVSLVEIRTGSKEQQQRISFAYNTASGFVDSAMSGAGVGLVLGGPVGAGIGALLGLAKQGLSMGINAIKQADLLDKQRALEQMQQNLAAQRVTVSGSRFMNASQM